jgi:hypothetical protein
MIRLFKAHIAIKELTRRLENSAVVGSLVGFNREKFKKNPLARLLLQKKVVLLQFEILYLWKPLSYHSKM